MNNTRHLFSRAVSLACVLLAFSATANAGVIQCINEAGMVTYGDVPCKRPAVAKREASAVKAPPTARNASLQKMRAEAAERSLVMTANSRPAGKRGFANDAETMKAARTSVRLLDDASALNRQQILAEREARPSVWEFWRS